MTAENALVMFVKMPEAGRVKTRLQPELSPEQSLTLYTAMVEDLVRRLSEGPWDLWIWFAPPEAEVALRGWLGAALRYAPQSGGDLGGRMTGAFAGCAARGYRRTVIVGSDLPELDASRVGEAFEALSRHDLVLGPSEDGGYYLIGRTGADPDLFAGVAWSTASVFERTAANARQAGFTLAELAPARDIDTVAEVRDLWARLQGPHGADLGAAIPRTRAVLARWFDGGEPAQRE